MVTDPIADMLTRIRNAQAVDHETVVIPYSKMKYGLAKILEKEGWVGKVDTQGKKIQKQIVMELKYEGKNPVISEIKRISKPGCRVYVKKGDVKPVIQGYGFSIISTSEGLMTNKEAKKKNLGGELICKIW